MSIAKSNRLMPLATMEKIMNSAGANRVSEDAKIELKKILEDYANEISLKAVTFAKHAGRRTIKPEDIKLAIKNN